MQSAERPLLLIERLRVAYSGNPTPIIDGASLSLDRGEIGCVVGSSGCGKTTLLRAIAGFIGVEDGTIEIAGAVVSGRTSPLRPKNAASDWCFRITRCSRICGWKTTSLSVCGTSGRPSAQRVSAA